MSAKRFYLVILLLAIGYQQAGISADEPAAPANGTTAKAEPDEQLKLNRDALLNKGSSEQMRINAARVMLFSGNPLAREILLGALKQPENIAARMAVCKTLSQARAEQKPINDKENFIQPLLDILATEVVAEASSAAEATLIFEYEQIAERLEKIVTDASLPVEARLNAIYALKLQPDTRAVIKLTELVDDPQKQVAAGAEEALTSLGISVGKDPEARKQIIAEIKLKGNEAFLRERLVHRRDQMRKLKTKLEQWQHRYLSALDKIYDGISNGAAGGKDAAKGEFLAQHLAGSEATVKLWALKKVYQERVGTTPKTELPAKLEPILVNLISDPDRVVRLETANLLSLMGELNSAEKLLDQLKVEQDDEVKMGLFVALGVACDYAFSAKSDNKIPKEIRKQTLELATEYLSEQQPKKAQKGADVIKKLLEQNGLALDKVDVGRYLGLLADRYEEEKDKADGVLRGELLNAMAELCAQSSVCKAESAKLFKSLFGGALDDKTDSVREAAVKGLINIGEATALKILRKGSVDDPSIRVREAIIDLAGKVGGKDDLDWLAEKIGSNAESKLAWQAMLKIFKRSDAGVLDKWIGRFDSQSPKTSLSDDQSLSLLEMAEAKASGKNKTKMLKSIKEKLAQLYTKSGKFEQAAERLGFLHEVVQTTEEKERILADLLDVYLRWPNVKNVTNLVANRLLVKDLDPNDVVVRSIDNYFTKPAAGTDPGAILEALTQIKAQEGRPNWLKQLKNWTERLNPPKEPEKPKEAGEAEKPDQAKELDKPKEAADKPK